MLNDLISKQEFSLWIHQLDHAGYSIAIYGRALVLKEKSVKYWRHLIIRVVSNRHGAEYEPPFGMRFYKAFHLPSDPAIFSLRQSHEDSAHKPLNSKLCVLERKKYILWLQDDRENRVSCYSRRLLTKLAEPGLLRSWRKPRLPLLEVTIAGCRQYTVTLSQRDSEEDNRYWLNWKVDQYWILAMTDQDAAHLQMFELATNRFDDLLVTQQLHCKDLDIDRGAITREGERQRLRISVK